MPVLPILAALVAFQSTSIERYLQPDLHDLSFTTRVMKANQDELKKVNHDFGQLYRFDTIKVELKEPFKVRLDASVEDTNLLYVVNGASEVIRVPRMGVHTKANLAGKPGRRQTAFDFGLLTPSLFSSYLKARFVRNDRATGEPVFDISYQDQNDTSRSRVWVDPSRHIVSKREWYNQDGRQLATFFYLKPQQVGGVWIPTRLEVKNVDNQIAGITQYQNVRVNTGISDEKFAVR